jgi:hypothetical protein
MASMEEEEAPFVDSVNGNPRNKEKECTNGEM